MTEYRGVQIIFHNTPENDEMIEKAKGFIDRRLSKPIELYFPSFHYTFTKKNIIECCKRDETFTKPIKHITAKLNDCIGDIYLIGEGDFPQEKIDKAIKEMWYSPVYIYEEDEKQYIDMNH